MGCQATLDFASPPATGAHLSYYWTLNEAADLNKIDSAAAYPWIATVGNSSPAGLFSNGIQLDCIPAGTPPFYHGLTNSSDVALAFDAITSKGISFWFWIKVTSDATLGDTTLVELSLECHDGPFTVDSQLLISLPLASAAGATSQVRHDDFTDSLTQQLLFSFHPVVGAWHFIAATLDLVNKTLNLYLDGTLFATIADTVPFLTAPEGDLLLKYLFGVPHAGVVVVDELGISLKGALSAAQVTSLYNAGAGVTWPNITPIVPFP